ncbi:MAG TPA: cell wall-binding repeat-containing protein [Candidatus Limnocylindria bacterium]
MVHPRRRTALSALAATGLLWSMLAAPPIAVVPRAAAVTPAPEAPPCEGWADPMTPPATIRVATVVDGAVTSVAPIAFDDYLARALAAQLPASAPPAALDAAAILVRQAGWYLALNGHEGYAMADGTCYDARDDEVDLPLAPVGSVKAEHQAAVAATKTISLRNTGYAQPFFLPELRPGEADACDPAAISRYPVVPVRGVVACAAAGLGARAILHRYLDPGLTILDITELSGPTRYETAVAASAAVRPAVPAGTVFIATGLNYPDGLAAGPAAARLNGTLLLVPGSSIPASVAAELARLKPAAIRVLGGAAVVSDSVLAALRSYSPNVQRIYGATRYETAIVVSRAAFGSGVPHVFVATGGNYPDALGGASAGARLGGPVLLVPGGGAPGGALGTALAAELRRLAPQRIHVLGGSGVVSDATLAWLRSFSPSVDRLAGASRYDTAAAISTALYAPGVERLVVSIGDNFADALSAGPLGGPLLLIPSTDAWPAAGTVAEARRLAPASITVVGGPGVVPDLGLAALAGAAPPPASGRLLLRYFCTALPAEPMLDADGIPMTEYDGVPHYNAVQVSQYGLAHFERWLSTGDEADRETFLRMADWLVSAQEVNGLWLYHFPFGGQPLPWWSGMAQGQAVSLLARAYQETRNAVYLKSASLSTATMRRTISDAGAAAFAGGYWIEEFLPPYSKHTLNGFIFSIHGLDEWVSLTGDATVAAWEREALATLSAWLPRFDTGSWSYYNQGPPPGSNAAGTTASMKYHLVVVVQLRHLWLAKGDLAFRTYALKFAAYAANPPWASVARTSSTPW